MAFGQLACSSFLGLVIEKVGSRLVIMYNGCIFGSLASFVACFLEIPCAIADVSEDSNSSEPTEETRLMVQ